MAIFEFSLSRSVIRSRYTVVLTLGALIGVACLVTVTSLFNNYYLASENLFMGIHPHIRVEKEDMDLQEARSLARDLQREFPGILAIAPALYGRVKTEIALVNKKKCFCVRQPGHEALVPFDENHFKTGMDIIPRYGFYIKEKLERVVLVKGITVENNHTVSGLKKIINGSIRLDDLDRNRDANQNALPLAFYLQQDLFPGAVGLQDFLLRFPGVSMTRHHFLQRGTLGLGTKKGRYPLLVMSLQNAQGCLGLAGKANNLEIKLADPYKAEELSRKIKNHLGQAFGVENWIQQSRASFVFLGIIKVMILAIIFSISLVAAMGMVSTLTLIVMQNRGKIAVLKALGLSKGSIYKIFLLNTGLTGLLGVTAGSGLGLAVSGLLIRFLGEMLRNLGIKDPQILVKPGELGLIAGLVMILFVLTAVIPARQALAADVVEGLQEQ